MSQTDNQAKLAALLGSMSADEIEATVRANPTLRETVKAMAKTAPTDPKLASKLDESITVTFTSAIALAMIFRSAHRAGGQASYETKGKAGNAQNEFRFIQLLWLRAATQEGCSKVAPAIEDGNSFRGDESKKKPVLPKIAPAIKHLDGVYGSREEWLTLMPEIDGTSLDLEEWVESLA
jgi:hypothetical protein